jgi:hypothetical protein
MGELHLLNESMKVKLDMMISENEELKNKAKEVDRLRNMISGL